MLKPNRYAILRANPAITALQLTPLPNGNTLEIALSGDRAQWPQYALEIDRDGHAVAERSDHPAARAVWDALPVRLG